MQKTIDKQEAQNKEAVLAVALIVSSYMFEAVATDLLEYQPAEGKKRLRHEVKQLLNRQLRQNDQLLNGLMAQFGIQHADSLNNLVNSVMALTGICIAATPEQRSRLVIKGSELLGETTPRMAKQEGV